MLKLVRPLVLGLVVSLVGGARADDPAPGKYNWRNVALGGGGYITGVEIHPRDAKLIYLRTDVGGCYRYDHEAGQLQQLMNWVPYERRNLYGIAGLALDPTDTNILYVAAGMYDRAQDDEDHEVFISRDRGRSFSPLGYPGRFGANQTPDKYASVITVNPHNPRELWAGSRGQGLWKYDGTSWTRAEGIPTENAAKVAPVVFDPIQPGTMYVAAWNHGVYRSIDGGKSFALIPGSSTTVHNIALNRNGKRLYAATTRDGVQRLDDPARSSEWLTRNTPTGGDYRAVVPSPHEDDTVVAARSRFTGIKDVAVSRDAGETWQLKDEVKVLQQIPWHPGQYPGSAIADFAWDPETPSRVYFTDWYSFWRSDDLFADKVTWTNEMGHGHEELVTLSLLAPPTNDDGVLLYSGHADVSGMRHTALDKYPERNFASLLSRNLSEVTSMAAGASGRVYLAGCRGHDGSEGRFAWSDDFGKTWTASEGYSAEWGWARIAVSPVNHSRVVAVTRSAGVKYSRDGGRTWSDSVGAPSSKDLRTQTHVWTYQQLLAADAEAFYLYDGSRGQVLASRDGGAKFEVVASGLPRPSAHMWHLREVPGQTHHLWASFVEKGLRRSTDGGKNWTEIAGVDEVRLLAIGAAAPGAAYPTVYIFGRLKDDKQQWFYGSIDEGKSWYRINDESARIGDSPQMMAADQVKFGRVFVGTNGTGVWVGELR